MRQWVVAGLCALAFLTSCGRESGAPRGVANGAIRWRGSIPEAMKVAGEQGKPVMAFFFSDRSVWCGRFDRETYTDPAVRELAEKFVSVRVDADKDPAARKAYGLPALPTVLFMDGGGKVVRRSVGFKPPGAFLAEMRAALGTPN